MLGSRGKTGHPRGRRLALSLVLLLLGSCLVPLALAGVWSRAVLLNTDRYVAAITPLIGRAGVQQAVAGELADRLLEQLDLENRITQQWPSAPPRLVQPILAQVEYYTILVSGRFVSSDAFVPIWVEANREAHGSLVNMIHGEGAVNLSPEGAIVVDLDAAAAELAERIREANIPLPDALLPLFPEGDVAIMDAGALQTVRPLLFALSHLYIALPILTVLCLVASVLVAPHKLRVIATVGGGMILTMLALQLGLSLGHRRYLVAASEARVPPEISHHMWAPLVGSLDAAGRMVLILGVGLLIAAAVATVWRARA